MSQVEVLKGKVSSTREKPLFWKTSSSGKQPYHWVAFAIVFENWKMMVSKDGSSIELYDLVSDPFEKVDLKEEKPEVVTELSEKLVEWKESLPSEPDASCFSKLRTEE